MKRHELKKRHKLKLDNGITLEIVEKEDSIYIDFINEDRKVEDYYKFYLGQDDWKELENDGLI